MESGGGGNENMKTEQEGREAGAVDAVCEERSRKSYRFSSLSEGGYVAMATAEEPAPVSRLAGLGCTCACMIVCASF